MNITHPAGLPITHIVSLTFASSESIVILFVTPNQEASQMGGGGMAGAAGWLAGWLAGR